MLTNQPRCVHWYNSGIAVIEGNQSLSGWIWGLLHEREHMPDTVNPMNKQTQVMARKVIDPKEELVISQTDTAPDFFLKIFLYS